MTHRSARSLAALLILLVSGAARAAQAPPAADPASARTAFPGRVIVKLRAAQPDATAKSTGDATVDAVLRAHGVTAIEPLRAGRGRAAAKGGTDLSRVSIATYADGAPPEAVAAAVARQPGVEYAEPQWVYPLCAVPNDANYATQSVYLNRMKFPNAWDLVKGEQGSVVIGLVDGGTQWNHPDLAANIWTNPGEIAGNSIDDDGNGFVDDVRGWNFANESNDPTGLPGLINNATHGTHTAGIACAVTNNAAQVCGASWNAKVMPVCASSPTTDNAVAFGYEGILYAADNGADILNLSWGSLGGAGAFELDVIQYAYEHGVAIVAAAGNGNPTPSSLPHYPSAYPHVLSVANVGNTDIRNSTSNYGTTVDVSAQGSTIYSTIPPNVAGYLTGTSMSSPHVAGLCALIKTKWPGYTPDQVIERARVTSDNIDAANPARAGLLGYGRVNALAALTKNTPAIRITHLAFDETDHDGIIEAGERVTVNLEVRNFLAACSGVSLKLRETSAYASVVDSTATLAALDSMQAAALPPLSLQIAADAPPQHELGCILAIAITAPVLTPAYVDKDRFSLAVLPVFATHDANNLHTSVTSVGKLGFGAAVGGTGSDGVGFRYKGGANLLYEGALMIGTGPARISDGARTVPPATGDDFATLAAGVPKVLPPGAAGRQEIDCEYDDSAAGLSVLPVRIRQTSYAYPGPEHGDYVLMRLSIHNSGATPLSGLRVGWFFDWDLDGSSFVTNKTGFDGARNLGFVFDTSATGPRTYAGVQVLTAPGATSYRGIWNDQSLAPDWGVYDAFTEAEKWECLSGGIIHPTAGPADVSNAIGTGPFEIAAGDSIEVAFAFLGGDDLDALRAHADAAALKWTHLQSGVPVALSELSAAVEDGAVIVRWRTGPETGVDRFRVLRAANGGALEPAGADVARRPDHTYEFRDAHPQPGMSVYRVAEVASDGGVVLHGGVQVTVGGAAVPARTFLDAAVPNPFNPSTTVRFGIATAGPADLAVYDTRGARLRTLWAAAQAPPGVLQARWDGRDHLGRVVASGVYWVRLQAGGRVLTRRVALLK